MARQEELPESITVGAFTGIRNRVARERLGQADLEAAVNVDIDDAGQVRRRRGYALGVEGDFHSVQNLKRGVLGVKDGTLGWIDTDLTFRSLGAGAGPRRVAAVQIGDVVYAACETGSWKIAADDTVTPWGASNDAGVWISPVVQPTETLGAISGRLLAAPPYASEIAHYNGRIYLAAGRVLWATELYLYDYVDKTRTFFQFEAAITLLAAVEGGLFVGTAEGLYFLQGTLSAGMERQQRSAAAVLRGSGVQVPADRVHPAGRQGPTPVGEAVVFMTSEGLCAGFDNGDVFNLTQERMVFPHADSAAVLYRDQDGFTTVVAVASNGGSPVSTARIGDYVEAEIIRAADRGV